MKITKFQHSCLLVEMPEPVNRTVLFDPGAMSESSLNIDKLVYLDDIIITHVHADHYSPSFISALIAQFPQVRITAPREVVIKLQESDVTQASSDESEGIVFFDSPHANVEPLFPLPEQMGVHYLDALTNPGDSHTFSESKDILALPIAGPWASLVDAAKLAIELKPKYVLPIHDWHLNDAARQQLYELLARVLGENNIEFIPLQTGQPIIIDV